MIDKIEKLQSSGSEKFVDWKNAPTFNDLNADKEAALIDHDKYVENLREYRINFNGGKDIVALPNKSVIKSMLIRKQSEWRYAVLEEPFLNSVNMFTVSPRTGEDEEGSIQNADLLNYQWNIKVNKVAIVTKMVRNYENEGTSIIKTGWNAEYKDKMVDVEKPVYATPEESIMMLDMLVETGEMNAALALGLVLVVLGVTWCVCFMERGQRRITVHYAKRQQGRKLMQGQSTHLPFKVNMAGVIPAIFASSVILFPSTIAQWFGTAEGMGWLQTVSAQLSPGQPIYIILYASLILFFCFFYTALVYDSHDTADNLKRSGAFIPGIRPGRQTAEYIDKVLTRLTFWGGLYVMSVCLLPEFLILYLRVPFYFGGTSLLIIVVVTMDFMAQLQSHMMSHQYDSMLKKANLRGYGRAGQVR